MRALLTIDLKDGNKIEIESKPSGNLVISESAACIYNEDALYITHKSPDGDELVAVLETEGAVPRLLVYQLADEQPSQIIPLAFGEGMEKVHVKMRRLPGSRDIVRGKTLVELSTKDGNKHSYLMGNNLVEHLLDADDRGHFTAERDDAGDLHNLSRIGDQGW